MRGGDGHVLFSLFSRCRIAPASGMSCILRAIKVDERRERHNLKCLSMMLPVMHTDVAPRKSSSISTVRRLFLFL
jgi:hypothetical protein